MNLIDVLIILAVIYSIYRWSQIGLVAGLSTLAGTLGGLVAGVLIAPWAMNQFTDPNLRFVAAMATIGLMMLGFGYCFAWLANKLNQKIEQAKLDKANSILGGVFSIFAVLIGVWLLASVLATSPFDWLNRQIGRSAVVQTLNKNLPPAPPVVARVSSLFNNLEFPQVFVGPAPAPATPVDAAGPAEVKSAVAAAGLSTVRIEGNGCGGRLDGSGFVVAEGLVMTNAHVVAGINEPFVQDSNGSHRSAVVYFNPDLDVAVLRTSNLAGSPLAVSNVAVTRGTKAAVLGFPGGGGFDAKAAGVNRQITARGLNIYGNSSSTRNIYELQTQVVPGNSGGPVVLPNGTVIGMVFARAEDGSGVGYAIISPDLVGIINQTQGLSSPVSTQTCVDRV
ncbi:MarP family serine protease [Candidatus Saccharibacteria bacterium]|nr:MarP family serine protease [Candidatus Saccharibacteria bacterium]